MSYWIERRGSGEKVFCFKVRRHGQFVTTRLSLAELSDIFNESEAIVGYNDKNVEAQNIDRQHLSSSHISIKRASRF